MLRRLIVLAALALLVPTVALADSVTFDFSGGTATAENNLSNAGDLATLAKVSTSSTSTEGTLGSVTFTTGEWNDATGEFDPGGSITITANGTGGLPDGSVFEGTFGSGTWTLVESSDGSHTFVYDGTVSGTVDPALLAVLGLSGMGGEITATIKITFTSGSNVGSVEFGQIVSHTPEPGTLALLGLGLTSMAAAQWRKRRRKQ